MNYKVETKILDSVSGAYAFKVIDEATGKYTWIPRSDIFDYIRFRIVNRGDRLADAYKNAGEAYTRIVPEANILPCMKLLYTNYEDNFNEQRQRIFRPFGEWIFEEACFCLQAVDEKGRINLGDGFIVPTGEERSCVIDKMYNSGMSLSSAMSSCCPDIALYPTEQLKFIEDQIRNTNFPFYSILKNAHTDYMRLHYPTPRVDLGGRIIVPSSDEIYEIEAGLAYGYSLTQAYFNICNDILPVEPLLSCIEGKVNTKADTWLNIFKSCQGGGTGNGEPKNNTWLYVIVGVGLLLLLSRKA